MNTIGILSIIIAIITVIGVIITLLFNAKIKNLSLYWIVSLIGAIIIVLLNVKNVSSVFGALIENSQINPLKILIFFFV